MVPNWLERYCHFSAFSTTMMLSAPFSTAARAAHSPESAEPMIRMSHCLVCATSAMASGASANAGPLVAAPEEAVVLSAVAFGAHPATLAPAAPAAAIAPKPRNARRLKFF